MRFWVLRLSGLFAAAAGLACGQSTVTTYTPDLLNGGSLVKSAASSSDHTQTQITQSLNGVQVPLDQREERVLRSDASGSLTETTVKRYNFDGTYASTERIVTETRKSPNGSSSVIATTYRSDVNGSNQLVERRTEDTQVAGKTTTVNTTVEQPGMSGNFEAVEKRSAVTEDLSQGKEKMSSTTESIYRGNSSSGLREAVHKVTIQTQKDHQTIEDTTDYERSTPDGALEFQERRVSTTTTTPGGAQSTIVDVYAPAADGIVQSPGAPPQLKQQQILTRVQNADGTVVDTVSVREPNVSDPARLGAPREITRTVCTGKCGGPPVVPAEGPSNDPTVRR